jgi:hypothetical protein
MQIKDLSLLNVTILLEESIDHNVFANKDIFNIFSNADEDIKHVIIEGPGVKIYQFPENKFEVIFEPQRLIVNDKSGVNYMESLVSEKTIKIAELAKVKSKAFGYNFDFRVEVERDFVIADILGKKLSDFDEITSIGASLQFKKAGSNIGLDIKPINAISNEFIIHVNVHHDSTLPVSKEEVIEKLNSAYGTANEVILSI